MNDKRRELRITMTKGTDAVQIQLILPPPSLEWIMDFVQTLRSGGYDVKLEEHSMVGLAEDIFRTTQ